MTQKLYGIFAKKSEEKEVINALLNSSITRLFMEIYSNELTGAQTIIDITVNVVENLFIINPEKLDRTKLKNTYNILFSRNIGKAFEECGIDPESDVPIPEQEPKPMPDRAELDKVVFDALDLTVDERKEVYRAVCQLVWNRINKAKTK